VLNGAERHIPTLPRTASHSDNTPGTGNDPSDDVGQDTEATARDAIGHLAFNGLALRWDLPGEPSQAVRSMVEYYRNDPETGETLSELACKYFMQQLVTDQLKLGNLEMSGPALAAHRRDERQRQGETRTRPLRSR
jgi:hypothetical protein